MSVYLCRSVVSVPAGLTVDAVSVLLTVDTDSSSSPNPSSVQTQRELSDGLVVETVDGFVVAVTL